MALPHKDWPYPIEIYHCGGTYRVVWGPEEHGQAKSEGWTDSPEEGKKYISWAAEPPPEHEDDDVPALGEADRATVAIDIGRNDGLRFESEAARNNAVAAYKERSGTALRRHWHAQRG